ncbi:hypothetical protein Tco_0528320 [Tanacetum coccineum]
MGRLSFGRPYRTHLNGPRKLLTARKRVGPLPAHRLTWRHASPHSSDHHSSSSSSSSDSSSSFIGFRLHQIRLILESLTVMLSPRLCNPSRRAPRRVRAFHLGVMLIISISLVDYVPSSTPVIGSLASTRADLLPPRKRFRDSYLFEASIEEDTEIDPIETEVDMELGIGDGDDVRDHVEIDPRDVRDDTEEYEADTSAGDTVEVGIDPMSAPIVEEEIVEPAGEDSSDSSGTRDGIVRSFEDMPIDLDDVVRDFYHHMSEVRIDRIVGIETVQRRLEADQLIARGQRVSMIKRINSLRREFSLGSSSYTRDLDLGNGKMVMEMVMEMTMEIVMEMVLEMETMEATTERTHKTTRCCSNCQQLDVSKVKGLCCKKRREQEEIEQQLWKQA